MQLFSTNERVLLVCLVIIMLLLITYAVYLRVTYKHKISKKIHIIDTVSDTLPNNIQNNIQNNTKSRIGETVTLSSYKNIDTSVSTWNKLGKKILDQYHMYDAIIIVIQPDILPYVAAGLSFMIENLNKPVILTTNYSKILHNQIQTVLIPEVMVEHNNTLFRASRITPNMVSMNYPPLTEKNCLLLPRSDAKIKIKYINPNMSIAIVYVYPGISQLNVSSKNTQGVILVCLNNGKVPTQIIKQLAELTKNGVTIVAVSDRAIVPEINRADPRLIEAGAIYGYDLTIPAAYAKLYFLLSHIVDRKVIGKMIETNLRGEITV